MRNYEEKFWAKVDKTSVCWNWTGATTRSNKKGYGQASRNGAVVLSHRLSWEIINGPISKDLLVLHRCDNPLCVNPAHLFLGSQSDNMKDCIAKGRFIFNTPPKVARNLKTHCPSGHLYNTSNSILDSNGYRKCRKCSVKHSMESKRRKRFSSGGRE